MDSTSASLINSAVLVPRKLQSWLSGFLVSLHPLQLHRLKFYLLSLPSRPTSHHFSLLSLNPSFLNSPDPQKGRCVNLTRRLRDSLWDTHFSPPDLHLCCHNVMTPRNNQNQACQIRGCRRLGIYSFLLSIFKRVPLVPQTNHGHNRTHGFLRPHLKVLLPHSLTSASTPSPLRCLSQAHPRTDSSAQTAAKPLQCHPLDSSQIHFTPLPTSAHTFYISSWHESLITALSHSTLWPCDPT